MSRCGAPAAAPLAERSLRAAGITAEPKELGRCVVVTAESTSAAPRAAAGPPARAAAERPLSAVRQVLDGNE